jgi:hypothetical protein
MAAVGEIIRLTLTGDDARPGRIPAADVARLLIAFERVVARAAEARTRRVATVGRRGAPVETSTHMIFRGIEPGSLVAVLEIPDLPTGEKTLREERHLGGFAAADVQDLIHDPASASADRRVVAAANQLGDELGIGARYDSLSISVQHEGEGQARMETFNGKVRRALRERALREAETATREDQLFGVLVEADFEERTAHVRTADNLRVPIDFGPLDPDEVYYWLRRPGVMHADISYTPSGVVARGQLLAINEPHQLDIFTDAIAAVWNTNATIDQLIEEQGIDPIEDVTELQAIDASDEEIAAFLDAMQS